MSQTEHRDGHDNPLLKAALAYAAKELPVFPCKPGGKEPLTPRGFKDATTDQNQIRQWWSQWSDANVAIPMGEVSGLIALDIDGEEGIETLKGRSLPGTVVAATGKGWHLLFRWPGYPVRPVVRLLPGVDVRGDGSYIIAPSSLHPTGKRYAWAKGRSLDDIEPADSPGWLLEMLREPAKGDGAAGEPIEEGQRNATLTSLAGSMRRRGMIEAEIFEALLVVNRRCKPPLNESEVRAIAASVGRYAPAEDARNQGRGEDVLNAAVRRAIHPAQDFLDGVMVYGLRIGKEAR